MKSMRVLAVCLILLNSILIFGQTGEDRGVGTKTTLPASAKRLALVIGNGDYRFADKLKNPVNDAADMARALQQAGFEVISGTDLSLAQMRKLIREFGAKLQQQRGVGLFYYAGHGVQVGGGNYLIPIDADIQTAVETPDYSVDTDLVLRFMREAGNDFNMVILDACRNNPFARRWRQMSPNRSVNDDQGLARITPPSGTVILYSTEPGAVASDGRGRNGLFTESLLAQINKPNVEFDAMVKLIARDVKARSGGAQSPWKEGLYDGEFCFSGVCGSQSGSPSVAPVNAGSGDAAFWQEAQRINTISAYERYLAEFPKGEFVKPAKLKLGSLKWADFKPVAAKLAQYRRSIGFSEGLAPVSRNRKYGFIDKKGDLVIPLEYDSAEWFYDGLAAVTVKNKIGFIDRQGKMVIQPKYDRTFGFSEDLAAVFLNEKWGFINKRGEEVIPFKYDDARPFSDGRARVGITKEIKTVGEEPYFETLYGFVDEKGEEVIPIKFKDANPFRERLARVQSGEKNMVINEDGNEAFPLEYESVASFFEGLAEVAAGEKSGYIDRVGKLVIPLKYDAGEFFIDGRAVIVLNDKYGLIDKRGKEIVPPKYDYLQNLNGGFSIARLDEKTTILDREGNELIPFKEYVFWTKDFLKEGFIGINLGDKFGFIDIYGNEYFDF